MNAVDQDVVAECPSCDTYVHFEVLKTHVVPDRHLPGEFTFAACAKCRNVAVFSRVDWGEGFSEDDYLRVFPAPARQLFIRLPPAVREAYDDSVKCEAARLWVPCVVMTGRALELVVNDQVGKVRRFAEGLRKMRDNNLISQEMYEWGDALRLARNMGAHEQAHGITKQDALEMLDFLQAILETIYHMRPMFLAMKARNASR